MSKALWKFRWDCGRNGEVSGLFTATKEEVSKNHGKYVYFGEVLGKHSEVNGILEPKDVTMLSDDETFVNLFEKNVGTGFGYNPLQRILEMEEEGY